MPSSITLTVSHLASSTSFFLSTLQPLGYVYRGRVGNTIGFGSSTNSSAPTDFWLQQETARFPVGAAHVAFPAPSRQAVHDFFVAALKAGGRLHGEPAVRDSSGYYSAAVIDFDSNSIEAVYRPNFSDEKENNTKYLGTSRSSTAHTKATSTTPESIVYSAVPITAGSTTLSPKLPHCSDICINLPPTRAPSGDILNGIVQRAKTAANLAKQVANNTRSSEVLPGPSPGKTGPTEAIVGTLLGVAAGAALHYAFSNRTEQKPSTMSRVTEPTFLVAEHYQVCQGPDYQSIEVRPSGSGKARCLRALKDFEHASTVGSDVVVNGAREYSSNAAAPSSATRANTVSEVWKLSDTPTDGHMSTRDNSSTSYKAPTVITNAEPVAKSSVSRSRLRSSSAHSRRSGKLGQTIVHVTEETIRQKSFSPRSEASTVKPAASKARTIVRKKRPEEHPLPASTASTRTGSFRESKSSDFSAASKHSKHSRHKSTVKNNSSKRSEDGQSDLTKSVVGKFSDVQILNVTSEEVKPEDSVSQLSCVRESKKCY